MATDRRDKDENPPSTQSQQLEGLLSKSEETRRALWGHNGTPGLITRIELLSDQVERLSESLQAHIKDYRTDRQRLQDFRGRVFERIMMWAIIGALAAVLIGGKFWIVQEVTKGLP